MREKVMKNPKIYGGGVLKHCFRYSFGDSAVRV